MTKPYSIPKSKAHYQKAAQRLPLGVTSNYRSWGEEETLNRLSTRVPGLGNPDGRFDLQSAWMLEAADQEE